MSIRKKLKVAVLVINYNGKHYLKECLESLKNQTYSDYDVYVVANGSVDGSVRYVDEHFPWVRVIAF
jgi:GT2 family glycosyltransferase